jgi:hypothetical protein
VTAAATDQPRPDRQVWRPLGVAAVGALLLSITLYGALATASVPEVAGTRSVGGSAGSGSLSLMLQNTGAGFRQEVTGLAPGDVVLRTVVLVGGGSLTGQDLALRVAASPTGPLTVDGPRTRALRVSVDLCASPPGRPRGDCNGGLRPLLIAVPLSALSEPVPLEAGSLDPGRAVTLRVRLELPDQVENGLNGLVTQPSIQSQRTSLTWTFSERQ